jgi:hypothetical protein
VDAVTGIGALVFLAGYTLTWFGYARLKGPGMGILDLIVPSHLGAAQAVIAGWSSSTSSPSSGPGSVTNSDGASTITPGGPVDPYGNPTSGGGINVGGGKIVNPNTGNIPSVLNPTNPSG